MEYISECTTCGLIYKTKQLKTRHEKSKQHIRNRDGLTYYEQYKNTIKKCSLEIYHKKYQFDEEYKRKMKLSNKKYYNENKSEISQKRSKKYLNDKYVEVDFNKIIDLYKHCQFDFIRKILELVNKIKMREFLNKNKFLDILYSYPKLINIVGTKNICSFIYKNVDLFSEYKNQTKELCCELFKKNNDSIFYMTNIKLDSELLKKFYESIHFQPIDIITRAREFIDNFYGPTYFIENKIKILEKLYFLSRNINSQK